MGGQKTSRYKRPNLIVCVEWGREGRVELQKFQKHYLNAISVVDGTIFHVDFKKKINMDIQLFIRTLTNFTGSEINDYINLQ